MEDTSKKIKIKITKAKETQKKERSNNFEVCMVANIEEWQINMGIHP